MQFAVHYGMYQFQTASYRRVGLSSLSRTLILLGFVVFLLALIGCTPNPQPSNQTVVSTNTNSNQNAQAPATPDPAVSRVPITLPVVDALLAEDTFVAEVRRSVQPSDEQLDRLKNAARDAVLKLSEDGSEDDARSTRNARSEAEKRIKEILGSDGGQRFIALAQKYWAGGEMAVGAKPNEVPDDTRVVVNAPAYRMDIFQDGRLVKSYKVGIGYPEFPLPVGVRTAKSIIFNPPWTPPDEPWVKGEFRPGKRVEPGSKNNPLGLIKIPIGLPSLIHGGKDPSRLGNFASHGCVGLTNPLIQEFSVHLASISGTQLLPEQIKQYEQKRSESTDIKLAREIPVELRYETIVASDGKLHIFRDVYEHGTNTEENLNRVLAAYGLSMNDLSPDEQAKVRQALQEMAVDATGKPVDDDGDKDQKPSTSSRVTRNIKGKREIVVDVAALRGKGYPAPVNINA